jgi:hypothetical protein
MEVKNQGGFQMLDGEIVYGVLGGSHRNMISDKQSIIADLQLNMGIFRDTLKGNTDPGYHPFQVAGTSGIHHWIIDLDSSLGSDYHVLVEVYFLRS